MSLSSVYLSGNVFQKIPVNFVNTVKFTGVHYVLSIKVFNRSTMAPDFAGVHYRVNVQVLLRPTLTPYFAGMHYIVIALVLCRFNHRIYRAHLRS